MGCYTVARMVLPRNAGPASPQLTAARLREVVRKSSPPGIVAVWLFGSVARGEAGRLSDVDVAVLFDEGVPADERVSMAARCASLWAPAVAGELQVLVANDAPPAVAHRVLRDGILLLGEDDRRRVAFEARVLLDYLDFQPVLERYDKALLARAREGRLGT